MSNNSIGEVIFKVPTEEEEERIRLCVNEVSRVLIPHIFDQFENTRKKNNLELGDSVTFICLVTASLVANICMNLDKQMFKFTDGQVNVDIIKKFIDDHVSLLISQHIEQIIDFRNNNENQNIQ